MSHRINKKLVMDALRMGIWRSRPKAGLSFHSDLGITPWQTVSSGVLKQSGSVLQNTAPGKKQEEMLPTPSKCL